MRYCPECGKKFIEPDEKFCPECGADLSKEIAGAKRQQSAKEAGTGKGRSGFGVVLLVLGVILFIGVVLLVLLIAMPVLFLLFNGGGAVGPDPCANVVCNNYCTGATSYSNGVCVLGQCVYSNSSCQFGCGNGSCLSPAPAISQINISFANSSENESNYLAYCDKIDPYDLSVREAAAEAIKKHPGPYNWSFNQLFDIYDWVRVNIEYQNVAFAGIPYKPSETLTTKTGDCKNQAVLAVSMIRAVGGKADVIVDYACGHTYAIAYVGPSEGYITNFSQAVANRYNYSTPKVNYIEYDNGTWAVIDTTGGYYPGDMLKECTGNRTVDIETGCLDCVNMFPKMPYTYNGYCYSLCPSGTFAPSQYTCEPCPEGYDSFNNTCLKKCQTGEIRGGDGVCYQTCGSPTTFCLSGHYCYNGHCYKR
jgi:hypothetical protein